MESTETSNRESPVEDLEDDNSVVRFVSLVLLQAAKEGATEITFTAEDCREAELAEARKNGVQPTELEALLAALENHGTDFEHFFPSRGFMFTIHFRVGDKLHAQSPPPRFLFAPVICRLCVKAGIRYWAKGRVEDFFTHTIGSRAVLWRAHSGDLRKGITLTQATTAQAEEYAKHKPPEVPPLPAPLPAEPLVPEIFRRPTAPRNRTEAIVWFVARMVFYPMIFLSIALVFWGLPLLWLLREEYLLWQPGDIMGIPPSYDTLSRICFSSLLGIATAFFIHLFSWKKSSTK